MAEEREYVVKVEFTGTATITVEAESEEQAIEMAQDEADFSLHAYGRISPSLGSFDLVFHDLDYEVEKKENVNSS